MPDESIVRRPHTHPLTHTCAHTYAGIYSLQAKQHLESDQYLNFQRAWYMQPSTATMLPNGKRTNCSNAVDATGRYIWRENGVKEGRCSGIDFQQAAQKWRANECSGDDPICLSAAITTYVPFAYDAMIAMAHGLDKLLHHKGLSPDAITADLLFTAIQQSSFEGVTGKVSFLENGDRQTDDLEYLVYNYHETTRDFQIVGQMRAQGGFTPCQGDCPRMIFKDGTSRIPSVRVSDHTKKKKDKSVCCVVLLFLFLASSCLLHVLVRVSLVPHYG